MAKNNKEDVSNVNVEELTNDESNYNDGVEENLGHGVSFVDNSFPECVNSITGIPSNIFGDIRANIERVGPNSWHKPYIEVLKQHGYDMIFFAYETPLVITTEVGIEQYIFSQLPTGKCILMGRDSSNNFKCVTGLMNDNHNVKVIFDPVPETSFVELFNIGFFIKTFFELENYTEKKSKRVTKKKASKKKTGE